MAAIAMQVIRGSSVENAGDSRQRTTTSCELSRRSSASKRATSDRTETAILHTSKSKHMKKLTSSQRPAYGRRAARASLTQRRSKKNLQVCSATSDAQPNSFEAMREASFVGLGMTAEVEPPESIQSMLGWQRSLVNVLTSSLWAALRFVVALALLLVPGFLFALFPNGAPPLVARMLVWANTITLLGLFASVAAAAISVAGSVAVHLLLRFRQATKDPDFVELERQQRGAKLEALGATKLNPVQTSEIVDATVKAAQVSAGVQDTEELRESIRISVTRLVEELVLQKATEVEEILSQRSIVAAKEAIMEAILQMKSEVTEEARATSSKVAEDAAMRVATNVAGEVFSIARDASDRASEAAQAVRQAAINLEAQAQARVELEEARREESRRAEEAAALKKQKASEQRARDNNMREMRAQSDARALAEKSRPEEEEPELYAAPGDDIQKVYADFATFDEAEVEEAELDESEMDRLVEELQSQNESKREKFEVDRLVADMKSANQVSCGPVDVVTGAASVPHPARALTGGEDAYFVATQSCTKVGSVSMLGVFDGVGGWTAEGVDAGMYARGLAAHCEAQVAQLEDPMHNLEDPMLVLANAHALTRLPGSATALVVQIRHGVSQARIANLGDCGCLLVRGGAVVQATPPLQHSFNFPYQLGCTEMGAASDSPMDADQFDVDLGPGDVMVLGSDGLLDNCFPDEIASLVTALIQDPTSTADDIAAALAQRASEHANDKEYKSPFAFGATEAAEETWQSRKSLPPVYVGGKLDDITVVVACVHHHNNPN